MLWLLPKCRRYAARIHNLPIFLPRCRCYAALVYDFPVDSTIISPLYGWDSSNTNFDYHNIAVTRFGFSMLYIFYHNFAAMQLWFMIFRGFYHNIVATRL